MTNEFGLTKLVVADLETSEAFYREVLGLEQRMRVQDAIGGRKVDEIVFAPTTPGGGSLVLLQFVDGAAAVNGEVVLVFRTDDIDGVFARGVAAGGSVVAAPREAPAYGITVGFLADNEGHLIEVTQPQPASST